MTTILTLAGEKGGIGKTTLSFHLSCYLADVGYRVLAVDLDPQGNLTYTFSGQHVDGVKRVVVQGHSLMTSTLTSDAYDNRLHLLGGNKSTGDVRNWLAASGSRLDALEGLMAQARGVGFDFVVVDTPPSPAIDNETGRILDALMAPAFCASDYVLAPVVLEDLPIGGLAALSVTLDVLQRQWSAKVRLLGVVPMMFDARTKEHAGNLNDLVGVYAGMVYPVVSRAIAVSRCPAYGLPVWEFAPGDQASLQLRQIAERTVHDVQE